MSFQGNKINASDEIFDVCFISMSDLKTDARTLNIIRTLIKNDKKVCVIAFGTSGNVDDFKNESINLFPVKAPTHKRAFRKWLYFLSQCKNFSNIIKAKTFWAADLFSLRSAVDFSKSNHAKLFYDSREIYSAIGSLHGRPIRQKIQTWLELKWIRNVDKVIITGELDRKYLQKHFNINVPYHVIKNLPIYRKPVESNIIREKFNLDKDKKILIYQGMLMRGRGILPVIKALPLLEEFIFCLIGEGDLKDEVEKTAKELNVVNRVILAGKVDYDDLHRWTCSADIGMSLIEPISISYELALPNKMFEYCMAGIPSIISDLPAMKEVIETHDIGYIVSTEMKTEDIVEAIKGISQEKNYQKYKSACIKASKRLSFEAQEEVIMSVFDSKNNFNIIEK